MTNDTKSIIGGHLKALAVLLFGAAAISFWAGGRIVGDRFLGELGGMGLAVVFGAAGAVAKHYGDQLEEDVEEAAALQEQDSAKKS